MAPLRTLAAFALCVGSASAFVPATSLTASQPAVVPRTVPSTTAVSAVFEDAVKDFESDYPKFAEWGWGPSVHAEKWNGRHAMFGWLFIVATAYAKGHGLFPDGDAMLTYKDWGPLALISGKTYITNERAIILFANVHCFFVGLMNTICPFPYGDPLLLDPNHPRYEQAMERNKTPFGVMPAFKTGLTEEAEMINGRLAMIGLIAVIMDSFITGESILDLTNKMFGGFYY
eukprot:CAMPEP_0172493572 /NCGR_PEP_ID=MMETSP1066-20121228/25000_1 /TAXON_ID=671091 /ORGANISM="Coscinodiscus wailesii, Strain CCMP2513" /LENGTH=229 /DNA_ID=CAMNT_0013263789 /DNA_START=80 /DNA_END=769 /DNA_ORIENTATION=-